jgi:ribosomal protein S18 acetylase RimI-like enzyme
MSNLRSEAFEEVRIKNKMKPFYIQASEEERKLMKDEKELYHLLFDGALLIGAVKVKGNYIDLLMTHKEYRGKGYGKKLLQYAINLIIKDGHSTSNLYIIDTNHGARKLYESIGFKNKETVKIYKKVLLG